MGVFKLKNEKLFILLKNELFVPLKKLKIDLVTLPSANILCSMGFLDHEMPV